MQGQWHCLRPFQTNCHQHFKAKVALLSTEDSYTTQKSSPSWVSTCVVGITVAVGVVVGLVTVAGVTIGRMLALGVDLFPAIAAAVTLLGVDTTGVGLMFAVGGSEVLALKNRRLVSSWYRKQILKIINKYILIFFKAFKFKSPTTA